MPWGRRLTIVRYFDKYYDKGRIKLEGQEKDLSAKTETEPGMHLPVESENMSAQSTQTTSS